MALILYLSKGNEFEERLMKIVRETLPKEKVEVYTTIDELSSRIHKSIFDIGVIVLCASNREELRGFLHLRDFLYDLRIILVLSEDDAETIAMAHALRPRFLTWRENNLSSIGSVLLRIVNLYSIQ